MWKLLLLGASLHAQPVSMECGNRAASTAQTRPSRGPSGVHAILKISSHDDYAKDTHDCMAEFQLIVIPPGGGAAIVADLGRGDGEWGRKLSVQLDGFSSDGSRIFGILSEGGSAPYAIFFDYHIAEDTDRNLHSPDLTRFLKELRLAKCGTSATVAGTTNTGAIVFAPTPPSRCQLRWLFDLSTGTLGPLPNGKSVVPLFKN